MRDMTIYDYRDILVSSYTFYFEYCHDYKVCRCYQVI